MGKTRRRLQRGFTIIEIMLVVLIIAILSTLAIPYYLRSTARAAKSEAQITLSKLELYFKNIYENQGTFLGAYVVTDSDVMPDPAGKIAIGQGADWTPVAGHGWDDVPFPPQGDIRMRYVYHATANSVTITVYGSFPGMGQVAPSTTPNGLTYNYSLKEVIVGAGPSVNIDDTQTQEWPMSL